jgi:hypothetical protein
MLQDIHSELPADFRRQLSHAATAVAEAQARVEQLRQQLAESERAVDTQRKTRASLGKSLQVAQSKVTRLTADLREAEESALHVRWHHTELKEWVLRMCGSRKQHEAVSRAIGPSQTLCVSAMAELMQLLAPCVSAKPAGQDLQADCLALMDALRTPQLERFTSAQASNAVQRLQAGVQAAEQLWTEAEAALAEAQPTNGHRAACWLLAVLQTGARAALTSLSSLTQEVSHAAAEPETVPSSLVREAQAALAQHIPAMVAAAQQPTAEGLHAVRTHAETVFSTAEAMLEAPLSAESASGRIWQRVLAFLLQVGYGSCK